MNPMVNAGAIATTSLVPGRHRRGEVGSSSTTGCRASPGATSRSTRRSTRSEAATNLRNQGIAHLLDSYDRLYFDPDEATDVYTRQCSLRGHRARTWR